MGVCSSQPLPQASPRTTREAPRSKVVRADVDEDALDSGDREKEVAETEDLDPRGAPKGDSHEGLRDHMFQDRIANADILIERLAGLKHRANIHEQAPMHVGSASLPSPEGV